MLEKIKKQCIEQKVPLIMDEAAQVISALVAEIKPKEALEVGSGIGYSGAVICSACAETHLTTFETDAARFKQAVKNLKNFKATCIHGDGYEFLAQTDKKFDFIFLDGTKAKYHVVLPHAVRALNRGGVLLADNIFFHGMVTGKTEITKGCRSFIRHLQKFIADAKINSELEVQILDKADGILVGRKK